MIAELGFRCCLDEGVVGGRGQVSATMPVTVAVLARSLCARRRHAGGCTAGVEGAVHGRCSGKCTDGELPFVTKLEPATAHPRVREAQRRRQKVAPQAKSWFGRRGWKKKGRKKGGKKALAVLHGGEAMTGRTTTGASVVTSLCVMSK